MTALSQIAAHFRNDPNGYARIVLGVKLTKQQQDILNLLVEYKRVLVKAGHNTGKTFLAAVAANWFYDCNDPGIVLTTAPTERQVKNILWKEIRSLRGMWGGFVGPSACLLQDSPKHFCHGFTARDDARFQGHHEENVLVIFDEAVGVDPIMWEASETMATHFLGIYNPTDITSYAYTAERSGNYKVVTLSALSHPNIAAELQGNRPPYPSAIRLERLNELIRQWCTPLEEEPTASDIEWPTGSKSYWRPGCVAEARLLGRWPTLTSNSVWTEAVWDRANTELDDFGPLQIGMDSARFGTDDTAIHVRKGRCSLHHEAHNGWNTAQSAARLRELAEEYGRKFDQKPKDIVIAIDDAGAGGGVCDQSNGYNFRGINAAHTAHQPDLYPNRRSELWFDVADAAAKGEISLSRLPPHIKDDLRRELLAPTYTLDYQGRRVVEKKADTKKRIGRSPDNADAFHLAYAKPKYQQNDVIQFKPLQIPKKQRDTV